MRIGWICRRIRHISKGEVFANLETDIVRFPDSTTMIADDTITEASFIGIGTFDSHAEQWCRSHGFDFHFEQASESVMFVALNTEGVAYSGNRNNS